MNLMKCFSGCGVVFEILAKNFIFCQWKGAFLVHSSSYSSYIQLCAWVLAYFMVFSSLFMNYMKGYEEGLFNGFFWNLVFFCCFGMNFENGGTSWKFINDPLRLRHLYPKGTLPQMEIIFGGGRA